MENARAATSGASKIPVSLSYDSGLVGWTQDRVIRQALLKEVRERTDQTLRPDWINLPGGSV
jgi:hypothetical protein